MIMNNRKDDFLIKTLNGTWFLKYLSMKSTYLQKIKIYCNPMPQ